MNIFRLIILITVIGRFLLDIISRWLNLKSLQPQPPPGFRDLYDPEAYARSQEYTRGNTRFHFVESTFSLIVFLSFWFSGGFNWLDQLVRSWGFAPIVTGLCFIALLGIGAGLLSLPFDLYHTFVIEEKFGF